MGHVNELYHFAKNFDKSNLEGLIKLGIDLNEKTNDSSFKPFPMSAGALLAAEGNKEAANLLISLGAEVILVAVGAAAGDHQKYCAELRIKYNIDVNVLAFGAALGGQSDYAVKLQKEKPSCIKWIAFGAAYTNRQEFCYGLLNTNKASEIWVANGAAAGGHEEFAERIRSKYNLNLEVLINGAQIGNQFEYQKKLQERWIQIKPNTPDTPSTVLPGIQELINISEKPLYSKIAEMQSIIDKQDLFIANQRQIISELMQKIERSNTALPTSNSKRPMESARINQKANQKRAFFDDRPHDSALVNDPLKKVKCTNEVKKNHTCSSTINTWNIAPSSILL